MLRPGLPPSSGKVGQTTEATGLTFPEDSLANPASAPCESMTRPAAGHSTDATIPARPLQSSTFCSESVTADNFNHQEDYQLSIPLVSEKRVMVYRVHAAKILERHSIHVPKFHQNH
jgi:hypothetical protein